MSIKYRAVSRPIPNDETATPLFYPSIYSSGRTSLRQLAARISAISTVSTIDTMAVLEAFLQVVPQELVQGHIVELGDFGSFWLRSKTEGAESAVAVNSGAIQQIKPLFRPGQQFKHALALAQFEKTD